MGMCQAKREPGKGESVDGREVEIDPSQGEPVYLNVYDLMIMNYTINRVGLGVYHTGARCARRVHGRWRPNARDCAVSHLLLARGVRRGLVRRGRGVRARILVRRPLPHGEHGP